MAILSLNDEYFMQKALELAAEAAAVLEVPVGAVLVAADGKTILGAAGNHRERSHSPIAHAEVLAIQQAAEKLNSWRLIDCTLYVTLEPCPMCAGALVNARVKRLVYGARDPKAGACGSLMNLANDERLNHRLEITEGCLQAECSEILKKFFKELRAKKEI